MPNDLLEDWKAAHERDRNYWAALHELKLTPQEQHIYNHHRANLDKGGVPHPDGSISSFLNFTTGIEGRQYVLPQVWDNQILPEDQAVERAKAEGLDKWPTYPTWQDAESRYNQIHSYMERDTSDRLNRKNPIGQPDNGPQNPQQ